MEARARRRIAFFGTGIAVIAYYFWLTAPPSATIPTPVLPSPNGHDVLTAAANLQVEKDAVNDAVALVPLKGHQVYSLGEKEALVAKNDTALAATRTALKVPYWNPPLRSESTTFPEFAKFRGMARIFALEAQVKAAHGDHAGAVSSLLDADEIGVTVPRGGALIADLVGIACEAIGDRAMWSSVDSLDAPGAAAAARRLEALDDRRVPYSNTLQEEEWSGEAIVLTELRSVSTLGMIREFTESSGYFGDGDGNEQAMPFREKLSVIGSFLTHSRRRIFAEYTNTMDAYVRRAGTPFNSAQPPISVPSDPLNETMIPVLRKARFKDAQIRMQSGLLECALALRSYRVSHGDYPASLKDLVTAGLLKKVPEDPFAKDFGTPFPYHRVNANKYILYSVGPDGIDDGGRPTELAKSTNPSRYAAEEGDKGDWVVGVDVGQPTAGLTGH